MDKALNNALLINPRLEASQREYFERLYLQAPRDLQDHIFLASSGSTQAPKLIALSRKAFRVAAAAVNKFLEVKKGKDSWLKALPSFHVGGLALHFRSEEAAIPLYEFEEAWSAKSFERALSQSQATLSALVPTQLFDLIQAQVRAPESLRAVLIGGDRLSPELYKAARELDWPLLPSYGMSESAAALAIAPLESLERETYPQKLKILDHIHPVLEPLENLFCFESEALCTASIQEIEKVCQWLPTSLPFKTSDCVEIDFSQRTLKFLGRSRDFLKIMGESVNFFRLKEIFSQFKKEPQGLELFFCEEPRKGHEIILLGSDLEKMKSAARAFNQNVSPFERVQKLFLVSEIPYSSLSKALLSADLLKRAKVFDLST